MKGTEFNRDTIMTDNVMISYHDKNPLDHQEKRKREKKQKTGDTLNGYEDEKQLEKKKRDRSMLFDESKAKRKKGMMDAMKAADKEKKVEKKRKEKNTKDDVIAGDEEQKKMVKKKKENVKESGFEVKNSKENIVNHSGNKTEILEDEKQLEKKKRDHSVLFDESKAKRKKGMMDAMKAADKEKKVEEKRKEKNTKDDVIAGDEEQKKMVKKKKENVKESGYEVKNSKENIVNHSVNKTKILEGRRDGGKKRKLETDDVGGKADSEGQTTKKKAIAAGSSKNPKPQPKKVRFSDVVEVFSPPDLAKNMNETGDALVRGKRFSKEEDEMVKKAVSDYIEENHLGEKGLDMVLNCQSHPNVRDCWNVIGAALPWRPKYSVYYRAHILYERGDRKWTPEELDLVRKLHEIHGSNWKLIAQLLGKFRAHVKDAWRRIKIVDKKGGSWSQDELQNIFDLVNKDLQMKVLGEKKSKYGMLRDNISWEPISTEMGTRTMSACCLKWYNQLTSPMVAEGKWSDADDYRLLMMLVKLDVSCEDEVDWDSLLEHRSGDLCSQRWKQMVNHIGEHGNKSFSEQVDVLANRYCPDLLEVRETWDAMPFVDE